MKIYTAGPLGFSEAGRAFHNGTIIPTLARLGHQPLDPWTLTDQDKIDAAMKLPYGQARKEAWQALNREIGNNNRKAIEGKRKSLGRRMQVYYPCPLSPR